MVLLDPELSDEALTGAVDQVSGLITGFGGEIASVKRDAPWGRRRLAYPIQRFRDATYVLYHFSIAPSRIRDIERDLQLNERVLRHLFVRQDELPEAEAESAETEAAAQAAEPATEPADEAGAPEPNAEITNEEPVAQTAEAE
jgi:small subunit ribosomal protein S6